MTFGQQKMKNEYKIDGAVFGDFQGFVAHFNATVLKEGCWHGNLDAFNDILNGGFGTPEDGLVLSWHNSEKSRKDLGYEATIQWLEDVMKKCHPSNVPEMQKRLADARKNQGATLFDVIVEIIGDHEDIELKLK
jgi:hypothetical protein